MDHFPTRDADIVIPGPPACKGSVVSWAHRGHIVTKTDSKHGKAWARSVALIAAVAGIPIIPKGSGVIVSTAFQFKRPARCPADRRAPCVRPDVDKMLRALLDALTGVAYEDDGQVITATVTKVYGSETLTRVWVDRA